MLRVLVVVLVGLALAAPAAAQVPKTFPPGFPVILDASLGVPVIGFGGAGRAQRTPVILLHGNNDTPFPTDCNPDYGRMYALAGDLHARGYALSELWALGYQGEQCDLAGDNTRRSAQPHTVAASVGELRQFVHAVLQATGARRVDIVGHSLGVVLAREWMRQDRAYALVRRLVAIDGPNHGIINCSPSPLNYYQLPAYGGFTPDSAVCQEFGSPRTPLLAALNAGDETPPPTRYLVIWNADKSFVYHSKLDGAFPPVPPEDREGRRQDFSQSALLSGARTVALFGQERYSPPGTGTSHTGILNSTETWKLTYDFLSEPEPERIAPDGLTLRVRRMRGMTLVARGTLRATVCDGTVLVRIRDRGRTLSARHASIDRDCRYRSTVTFRHRHRSLTVLARFEGSDALKPIAAAPVRVGR